MNYNKKISVIVPIYNMEQSLEKCVNSILNQTYQNLEIILVNDGSTDSSKEICEELKAKDSRIVLIDQKNNGVSSARNSGLAIAKGSFISFIDPDDYIDSNMYLSLYEIMIQNDADVVECGYRNIDFPDKPDLTVSNHISHYEGLNVFYDAYQNEYSEDCREKTVVMWNKLWKKELFEGLAFKEGCVCEDAWIVHYLFARAKKIVVINEPYYNYCYNVKSIMRSEFNENKLNSIYSIRDRVFFCKGKVDTTLLSYMFKEYVNEVLHLDDTLMHAQIDKISEKRIRKKILKMFRDDSKQIGSNVNMGRNPSIKWRLFHMLGWLYLRLPLNHYLY